MYIVEIIPPKKRSPSEYMHGENSSPTKWIASWSASFMLICVSQSCRHHMVSGWFTVVTIPLQCSIKLPRRWVDVNVCPYIHINSPYTMFPLYCNCEATWQHIVGFMPRNVCCSNGSNFLIPLVFGFHPEWILHTAKVPLFKLSPSSYLLVTHITSHGFIHNWAITAIQWITGRWGFSLVHVHHTTCKDNSHNASTYNLLPFLFHTLWKDKTLSFFKKLRATSKWEDVK